MRLDRLNLDKTDVAINSDQTQSVNLFSFKTNIGEDYHTNSLSAAMAHPMIIDGSGTAQIIVPMVFILDWGSSETIYFYMGNFMYDTTNDELTTPGSYPPA